MKKLLFIMLLVMTACAFSINYTPTKFTALQVGGPFALNGYVVISPNTATTVNYLPTMSMLILDDAGTVPTLGITLVASNIGIEMLDGQEIEILSSQAITSLNIVSTSAFKGTAPTTLSSGSRVKYIYRKSTDTFYKF